MLLLLQASTSSVQFYSGQALLPPPRRCHRVFLASPAATSLTSPMTPSLPRSSTPTPPRTASPQ